MFEHGAAIVSQIEQVLDEEIDLQRAYLEVVAEERKSFSAFSSEEVEKLSSQRSAIYEKMQAAQSRRIELMKQFPEFRGRRLGELVQQFCHPADAKRLSAKIKVLKVAVTRTKKDGSELGQIAQFSLNMVNGLLSLIWSGTQNVSRSYTRSGDVKETFQQPGKRGAGVIKEA